MIATRKSLDEMTTKGNDYVKPQQAVTKQNQLLRKLKEAEAMLREKIRIKQIDKAASKERQAALLFRYVEEKKRMDHQLAKVFIL